MTYDDWKTTEPEQDPYCRTCMDSQVCDNCNGAGCDECFQTGSCIVCMPKDQLERLEEEWHEIHEGEGILSHEGTGS